MTKWLHTLLRDGYFRGVRRGNTKQEVIALLGNPMLHEPERAHVAEILAYDELQVFCRGGVVERFTVRPLDVGQRVSQADFFVVASDVGLSFRKSALMSIGVGEYWCATGIHAAFSRGWLDAVASTEHTVP